MRLPFFWTGLLLVTGCVSTSRRHAASVVDYLYADRKEYVVDSTTTVLRLPLRVGIGFVPTTDQFSTRTLAA